MELEQGESRVSGARYYTVKPVFEHDALYGFNATTWRELTEWCVETYGPTPVDGIWTPGARWYANNAKFWFRNDEDRTIFMLRWA
jgi:hypothetical protein